MIPPKIKPPERWQPLMVVSSSYPYKPTKANEHFLVNSSRQAISRAMVSSRISFKHPK